MNNNLYLEYLNIINEQVPLFLEKYLTSPSIQRLKNISYFCGMDYASKDIYNFSCKLTRFDHSLSTALLTYKFTKDKESTIAALYHDVATPCFSHVIDYMNKDYSTQESTEKHTLDIMLNDHTLLKYLKEDNLNLEDIANFKKYSIVDNDRPKLCVDRFDGLILTAAAWTKSIEASKIKLLVDDLTVYNNEESNIELGFKSEETAFLALNISREIDEYCHSNEDNFMMELLANITRKAIIDKIISYEELFYIDENYLMNKLKNSNNLEITKMLKIFENIKLEDIPITPLENVKGRVLKPLVNNKRIG